ncbi:MAG: hypothetical protein LBF66_01050 [Holosporales bacterium]|nr:hypothetical protein [Holosporales bacterium]
MRVGCFTRQGLGNLVLLLALTAPAYASSTAGGGVPMLRRYCTTPGLKAQEHYYISDRAYARKNLAQTSFD